MALCDPLAVLSITLKLEKLPHRTPTEAIRKHTTAPGSQRNPASQKSMICMLRDIMNFWSASKLVCTVLTRRSAFADYLKRNSKK